jgi:phosphatidylglycerophosphatase A
MIVQRLAFWIASVFRIGTIPVAPGTAGSLAALIAWYFLIDSLYDSLFLLITFIILIVGVITSSIVIKQNQSSDPPQIVIDEWVGQWIALFLLPRSLIWGLVAFMLFRIFDISKFGPVKRLEKMGGGWGIMLDDVAAGIFAFILIQLSIMVLT